MRKPAEEWYRVENTHEAIISKEVFEQVQAQIKSRRRKQKNGQTQIFAGLVKCADCGWSLAYGVNKQNKTPYGYYHCSKNGQGLRQCSMHYIRYDVLYAYVLSRIQHWSFLAQRNEDKLLQQLLNASDKERSSTKKKQESELKKAEKRRAEIDGLFAKMYEDWSSGRIVNLAEVLETTVDNLLNGGRKVTDYKGRKTMEELKRGIHCLVDMGNLLGRENLLYRCAVEGIDEKLNMEIEEYLSQPYTYEAILAEAAIQCMKAGYYMDAKEIEKGFVSEHWRNVVSEFAKKMN